ncbi:MAG: DnaB-like helicase C-terminal domain-containing protein [Candidatus Riflebacteria bacterium]|nr:DnaB-like helicase C-terminal domain-containing protein [Candidatus Riflebacteria bacterium]
MKQIEILSILPFTGNEISSKGSKKQLSGISTGFPSLDYFTDGFQKSDLIVIASNSAMEKSFFAINIAKIVTEQKKGVLFFSLEMPPSDIIQHMFGPEAKINGSKIWLDAFSNGDYEELLGIAESKSGFPLIIDGSQLLSVARLRELLCKMHENKKISPISLIIIDSFQFIQSAQMQNVEKEREKFSRIFHDLKLLARELSLPVICLAGLNDAFEGGVGKKPNLIDLRESGLLEPTADVVFFLHCDRGLIRENKMVQTKVELVVVKQRNGPVGDFQLNFDPKSGLFSESSE